ncbi:leucine-rich repeat domain-containing protein [uncultured Apibacter sp.]|uniref:leucine-rich repeat domain-containing protein n=1 Tax=uncultured Apibacter sp. TaxID=1778616 RepID=UPI0025D1C00E|nr:leucine-rich repeat domain-containing protein [uncultured Apibacter sp.]
MKNCLTFLFYFFSIVYLHCQVKVIDVKTPGSLSKLLGSEINSITELKINGKINSVDFTTLKGMKKLSVLDLSNSGADDGILPAQAFSSCNVLKSITLPASLVTISKSAFEYASNVNIDASKCTQLKNIDEYAFDNVKGKIILPDQLESIPNFSFAYFNGTVVLPKNLKNIGEKAFYYSQINTLDLTQCPLLETIAGYAFQNAYNLNLDLSKATKLKNIGKYVFENVKGKIILPDHLEILPESSFADFNGTVVLPKNLKIIGKEAFYFSKINTLDLTQCPLLETIENSAFGYASKLNLDLSKATQLKNIGRRAFYYSKGKIILPDQLGILPEGSFAYFDGTVVLPKNLNSIGEFAFYNSIINTLDLTQCPLLETIADEAFLYAYNLNLDLSKATRLKNIGKYAFSDVKGEIILPDQWEILPEESFAGFKGTVVLPKNLKTIGEEAFKDAKINTLDLTQCPLLETIGDSAFKDVSNLNLDLSKATKLKNIGKHAFSGVKGNIILPDQLESLPEESFAYFNGTVVLPKNLKTIGKGAFKYSKIKEINLPGSLQSIADQAFYNVKYLSAISCNATTPPLLGENVFYGVNKNTCSLEVPDASRQLYAKAKQWEDF